MNVTTPGRPADRSGHIVRELRGRITSGHLAPGVQLPTRLEIEQEFGYSAATVQRALEVLQRDGFVTVQGKRGTFVSRRPPHLTNYALVFPSTPGDKSWNRFFAALHQDAPALAQKTGRQLTCYFGFDYLQESRDYERFLGDLKAHRIGGVILASVPPVFAKSRILEESDVPCAVIGVACPSERFGRVRLAESSFWSRAAEHFAKRGRHNLALLFSPRHPSEITSISGQFREAGFHVPDRWIQSVSTAFPSQANNLTQLLFQSGVTHPDALFITDDNLVEHALAGLISTGARVPDDVEIIAHCNFPHPVPSPVPVSRLGCDARRILESCFQSLDDQREGRELMREFHVPAKFDYEIEP